MNSRPSSEKVMGFAPAPGDPTMVVVPSGVRFPISPPAMSVQYIEPSGPESEVVRTVHPVIRTPAVDNRAALRVDGQNPGADDAGDIEVPVRTEVDAVDPCNGPPWASTVTVALAASGGAENSDGSEPPQPKVRTALRTQAHPRPGHGKTYATVCSQALLKSNTWWLLRGYKGHGLAQRMIASPATGCRT